LNLGLVWLKGYEQLDLILNCDLMKVIKESITQGVVAPPLKINLVLRFTEGEGLQGRKEGIR
jgi:hypothetical protein